MRPRSGQAPAPLAAPGPHASGGSHSRLRLGRGSEAVKRLSFATLDSWPEASPVAVEAFLNGGIRFTDIAEIIRNTMDVHTTKDVETLEDALEADRWAREKAESVVVALAR